MVKVFCYFVKDCWEYFFYNLVKACEGFTKLNNVVQQKPPQDNITLAHNLWEHKALACDKCLQNLPCQILMCFPT